MLRILCIGYCFPPVASSESYVTARIMGTLADARVDILTADHALLPLNSDHSLDAYVAERFGRVVRVTPPPLVRRLTRLPRLPFPPDRWVVLTGSLARAAQEAGLDRFDCMVTRSQFHSAHLVGLRLKRLRPSLPWLASFSDPWSGTVYGRKIPVASAWSARLEARVLARADGLVFPTAEMLAFVDRGHGAAAVGAKGSVVPHGYDASLYGGNSGPTATTPVEIGLFGSFYGPRTPHPLLAGLDALRRAGGPAFRLVVYGPNAWLFNAALASYPGLAGCVRHAGALDHLAALHRMQQCHLLAMVDAPMAPPSIFLPSKLVDYIGAGRPILAITPKGAAAETVRAVGGYAAPPDDTALIARTLGAAVAAAPAWRGEAFEPARAKFAIGRVAGAMRRAIEGAMARCAAQ